MRYLLCCLVVLMAGLSGARAQKEGEPLTIEVSFAAKPDFKERVSRYEVPGTIYDGALMPIKDPLGKLWLVKVLPDKDQSDPVYTSVSVRLLNPENNPATEVLGAIFPFVLDKDIKVFQSPEYAVFVRLRKADSAGPEPTP